MSRLRVLVVYYSRTGYTREVATTIANRLGADVEEIRDVRSRRGIFGYWRSAREALKRVSAGIEPAVHVPRDYDIVALGTPVWAGHLCSPMRAYLAARGSELPRVAFFCTQGGSGAPKVLAEMAELTGKTPIATLVATDREIKQRACETALGDFVRAMTLANAA